MLITQWFLKVLESLWKDSVRFVCQSKENRKYVELHSFVTENQNLDLGESTLIKDCKIRLYTGVPIKNKKGNIHYREELVDTPFRLVIVESKLEQGKKFWFLTNDLELSAKEIAQAYRRRWDIEVFFRFIKQELNVSHLVSLNKNGMQLSVMVGRNSSHFLCLKIEFWIPATMGWKCYK